MQPKTCAYMHTKLPITGGQHLAGSSDLLQQNTVSEQDAQHNAHLFVTQVSHTQSLARNKQCKRVSTSHPSTIFKMMLFHPISKVTG